MKSFLSFSILLAVMLAAFSCATTKPIEFGASIPDKKYGCGNAGVKFLDCLKKESLRWQAIESATGIFVITSTDRDGDYIVSKGKLCFSQEFCRDFSRRDYSPSLWSRVKEYSILVLLGIVGGFGAASQ